MKGRFSMTWLSALLWGFHCFRHRQYGKGVLLCLAEAALLLCFVPKVAFADAEEAEVSGTAARGDLA